MAILEHLKARFPSVERVTSYARARTVEAKKDGDLEALKNAIKHIDEARVRLAEKKRWIATVNETLRLQDQCRDDAMKLYQAGADGLAMWDEWTRRSTLGLRRLGHLEELKQGIVKTSPKSRVIRLLSLGGCDLTRSAIPTNFKRIYKHCIPYWYLAR